MTVDTDARDAERAFNQAFNEGATAERKKLLAGLDTLVAELLAQRADAMDRGKAADVIRFDKSATSSAKTKARYASVGAWSEVEAYEYAIGSLGSHLGVRPRGLPLNPNGTWRH